MWNSNNSLFYFTLAEEDQPASKDEDSQATTVEMEGKIWPDGEFFSLDLSRSDFLIRLVVIVLLGIKLLGSVLYPLSVICQSDFSLKFFLSLRKIEFATPVSVSHISAGDAESLKLQFSSWKL